MKIKIADKSKVTLTTPKTTAKILTDILKAEESIDKVKEHFWGIYLNSGNYVTRIELISLGILDSTIAHPRETLKPAIESNAVGFIVAHNHPSGDLEPSEGDLTTTTKLKKASEIMGIELLDHIIITAEGKYYSFKEEGIL